MKQKPLPTQDEYADGRPLKPMSWKKELLGFFCLLLALLAFCIACTRMLTPKRQDYGATWGMYLKEPEDSLDVLFYGSSLAYCDIVPSVIYEETGLASYVMAGPDQRIPITYRYLLESCKTQSPKAVLIEARAFYLFAPSDSTKVNLTFMPYNENRLIPTFQEAEPEDVPGLLFPLYAYHDRWDELSRQDLSVFLSGYQPDPLAGYTFLDQTVSAEPSVQDMILDDATYERNLSFAEQAISFCREQNITPVFFLAPRRAQLAQVYREKLREDLESLGAEFWDCTEDIDQLGLDFSTDFFDDLHFNYRGAEKFSRYLSKRLEDMGLSASAQADRELWQSRVDAFSSRRDEMDSQPVRFKPKSSGKEGGM